MDPAVGSRNLVSRLNTVVLPAPFGPISAWIVPRCTRRSTPCTAVKPRNSFVRPRVSRIRSGKAGPAESCRDGAPVRSAIRAIAAYNRDRGVGGAIAADKPQLRELPPQEER